MPSRYSFDPAKDSSNLRKHGVSLAEADGVLDDPLAVTIEDEAAGGEARWVTIGTNVFGTCLVVVWAPRGDSIRTLSVRGPDPTERRAYDEGV
jgi:uncharacterized DUF497 family protein